MALWKLFFTVLLVVYPNKSNAAYLHTKSFECGPYGFICEGAQRLRLCEGENLHGPSFMCPANTNCNEDSSSVCEDTANYFEPEIRKTLRCHKNERLADPTVPDCKGYILCIPNKNRFQGIKFKCSGNTIFNGYTRTCSAPDKYTCPISDTKKSPALELYGNQHRRIDSNQDKFTSSNLKPIHDNKPIECKNYKFSVTDNNSPVRAAYFCPTKPLFGETNIRCTVFSSKYCLTLERADEDQFIQSSGAAFRRPRM